jgi:hypothetical protein
MSLFKYEFSYSELSTDEYHRLLEAVEPWTYNDIIPNPSNKTASFFVEDESYLSAISFPDNCHLHRVQ